MPVMSGAVIPVSTCITTTWVLCTHAYYALSCLYCGLAPERNHVISLDVTFSHASKSLDAICTLSLLLKLLPLSLTYLFHSLR